MTESDAFWYLFQYSNLRSAPLVMGGAIAFVGLATLLATAHLRPLGRRTRFAFLGLLALGALLMAVPLPVPTGSCKVAAANPTMLAGLPESLPPIPKGQASLSDIREGCASVGVPIGPVPRLGG